MRRRNDDDRRRPIVILAGWLGCHPKNLQRHVQMYDRLGYNSLIRIPSPASVVHAMQDGPENQNDVESNSSSSKEMKHIAITTLQHIQQLQPTHFIIHIFSNNGCFLWEWIRCILLGRNSDKTGINTTNNLQNKLRGIIFDSAPAYYHGKIDGLQSALEYVGNEEERVQLVKMARSLNSNQVERRHNEFWSGLSNHSQSSTSLQKKAVPQLYLYSDCDPLANMKYIEELVVHRREIIGEERVWSHKFIGSSHCGHLKKYPTMYEHTVQDFLEFCIAPDGHKRCRL